jgi:hypothetical protein
VRATALGAPRPVPGRLLPVAGGAAVIALALPVFVLADWRLGGWAIAALVWLGAQAVGFLLARLRPSADNLAASGVLAFGMMGRLLGVLVVLLAVAASDRALGLAATLLYALAYTVELAMSVGSYYVQDPTR